MKRKMADGLACKAVSFGVSHRVGVVPLGRCFPLPFRLVGPDDVGGADMRWAERHVHEIWLGGRWVEYPIRVHVTRRLSPCGRTPSDGDGQPYRPGTVVVWVGPEANQPWKTKIDPPRAVTIRVPVEDLQYPQWRSFYASKVIAPEQGCAWVYEIGDADLDSWCNVIWKVWDL